MRSKTPSAVAGIEVAGGLIRQDEARSHNQCPREGYPLLLAARQLSGLVVAAAGLNPTASNRALGALPQPRRRWRPRGAPAIIDIADRRRAR